MSSLYSQPSTRRSSASDRSSPLPTPTDDIPLRTGPGKSTSRLVAQDTARIYSPSDATPSELLSVRRIRPGVDTGPQNEIALLAVEPGSYFARPSRHTQGAPELNRRGTAKELIGRFEAMGDSSAALAPSSADAVPPRPKRKPSITSRENSDAQKKEKGRSPIRQSFRNLLSVFKKSKPIAPVKDQGVSVRATNVNPKADCGDTPTPPCRPGKLSLQIPQSVVPAREEPVICISPVSAHTGKYGPLLYLAPKTSSKTLPVWMDCDAQLHSTHILVMWKTPGGNPSPTLVSFTACTDVRSLASSDLDPEERSMLPGDPEWKVFELLFEGRARQRFAARSLTDRATWVSAIWDAILLAQENRVRTPAESHPPASAQTLISSVAPPTPSTIVTANVSCKSANPTTQVAYIEDTKTELPVTASRISRISMASKVDRDLPPVPGSTAIAPKPPAMDQRNLSASALSSLPAPPHTPTSIRSSYLSPTRPDSPSRTQSPSIRNLDQRSMVKQRLAQIEKGSPTVSSPKYTPPMTSRQGSRLESLPPMRREGSEVSSVATSILNSYLGLEPVSPSSVRSGGLTTLASRMGSPPPRMSVSLLGGSRRDEGDGSSRLLGLPRQNGADILLSPGSQYSADEEEQDNGDVKAPPVSRSPVEFSSVPTSSIATPTINAPPAATDDPSAFKPVLENIREGVVALQGRSAADSTNIVNIRIKVDELLTELRCAPREDDNAAVAPVIMGKLEQLQVDVKDHLAGLQASVEGLREDQSSKTPASELPGLAALHEKLDELVQLSQHNRTTVKEHQHTELETPGASLVPGQVNEVLSLLKDAEEQRAAQMEQQTDSIRYLNELNNWLEAFVKHGTSQIEGVAAGIQQLCRDLGPVLSLQGSGPPGDTADQELGEGTLSTSNGSLIGDIRRLVAQNMEREQSAADLHASVNGLIAAVQEDLRRTAEARDLLTAESVVGMIDRQRQDQERMLKALATELSNDIRGERLRFVEAMKEATAINVQIHVEEFKKELTREVLLMTQEVTRLERERQGLEQQIADLFAFYAKQQNAVKGGHGAHVAGRVSPQGQQHAVGQPGSTLGVFPGALVSSQSIPRRPLPSPVPSSTRMRVQ